MLNLHIATSYPSSDLPTAPLASVRLRLALLAQACADRSIELTTGWTVNDSEFLYVGKLSPSMSDETLRSLISSMEKYSGIVILDYTDDWLSSENSRGRLIYKTIIRSCSVVVTSSEYLQTRVKSYAPNAEVVVIPDLLEFQLSQRSSEELQKNPNNILWFGHPSNLNSLVTWMNSKLSNFSGTLHAVTSPEALNVLKELSITSKFKTRGYSWCLKNMLQAADASSCCIIPAQKRGASENRLVTALALGLPTIADVIPSYESLRPYFINSADIKMSNELMVNPGKFSNLAKEAQINRLQAYQSHTLLRVWGSLLDKLVWMNTNLRPAV